jgi:hypothetical protein
MPNTQLSETAKTQIANLFIALKEREENPEGSFDKAGRFYLENKFDCCDYIRTPSRRWPYSEMLHGRTLEHAASEILGETPTYEQLSELRKRVNQIKKSNELNEKFFEKYIKTDRQKKIVKDFMNEKEILFITVDSKKDKDIVTIVGQETKVYELPKKTGISQMISEILVTGEFNNIKKEESKKIEEMACCER